jgi:hypothetical protein
VSGSSDESKNLLNSMSTASLTTTVPRTISRKVSMLRWLVRGYVALEGLAATIIAAGVAFWLALGIDWLFEPSPGWRIVMWGVAIAGIAHFVWHWLAARFFARLTDSNLALLLERSFPQIEQSLVTTLQAGRRGDVISPQQSELLAATSKTASDRLQQVRLGQVFRYSPLLWKLLASAAFIASIVAFATAKSDAYEFWLSRMRLSNDLWPRRVQLSLVGFDSDADEHVLNVARDDDFQLEVLASLTGGHVAPPQVEIRYELADGRRGRDSLTQIGTAVVGQDESQKYRYEFKNLAADISFDIVGGDDRIRNLRLHVVERPQIIRTALACEFPSYLGWSPQTLPFSGRAEVPYGTNAICQGEANKPLRSVRIYDSESQHEITGDIDGQDPRKFTFQIGSATVDQVFLVDMKDTDDVGNREPYRLMIAAVPDEVPEVSVQLRGISSAITPQATIPLVGTLDDDHGIADSWIEGTVDKREPQRRTLAKTTHSQRESAELGRFDLAEIDPATEQRALLLEPGERLTLAVKARDGYDLGEEPHVGTSQRFILDVVTDSQLRALLEKRELGLRQRFEALHEKMISTRDLLGRIDLNPPDEDNAARTSRLERDKLRLAGIQQSVAQIGFETLGVADGFDDIVTELANNRIATEELNQRLGHGIADPLRIVASELLPTLDDRVQQLTEALESAEGADQSLADAVIQADLVVEEMQRILSRMLELESYNELVELLRTIVDEQQQLNEETKVRRREKLRSLLDE